MDALLFLVPIAVGMGGMFALFFIHAVRSGQFEDLDDPPQRMLHDE